jgi:hypothetical protein
LDRDADVPQLCPELGANPAIFHILANRSHTIGVSPFDYWGQSFRIDFLICQLEDINPKGLTLIREIESPK